MRPLFSQSTAGCSGASWEGRASSYMGGSSSMLSMSSHIRVTLSCNNSDSDPMPLLLWYSASLLFSSSSLQKCKIHNSISYKIQTYILQLYLVTPIEVPITQFCSTSSIPMGLDPQ
jgi:hypothetical protein